MDDLESFRAIVLQDPDLQNRLLAVEEIGPFTQLLIGLARQKGLDFTAGDVRWALDEARTSRSAPTGTKSLNLDGWIPYRIHWAPEPAAEWCRLDGIRFTEPFFELTMRRAMRHPFRLLFRHETPMEVLEERLGSHPGIAPSGFIFHTSRCGSTLVSRMLASSERNVVIAEGWPVDSVITADVRHPEVTREQRVRWLRAVIAALGQPRAGSEDRCFVKFDCWHALDLPLVREAFPDVPWVFVYREPVEVLASQLRMPAAWIVPGLMAIRSAPAAMLPIEYGAAVMANICEAALRAMATGGGMLLHCRELPGAVLERLAAHFGCRFGDREADTMRAAARQDAKNPHFRFAPDRARKQIEAPAHVRELADRVLADVYRRLEAYRATSL